ncbi:phosphoribosylformylglycinamidine synthase, purS [Pyrolobus fumarii 1A]|uniref:Phosphoribosylformylglycinamidine synthase subunit PurS n=1 Tax=Pyrolobus fumarii (strain DSM 11204 / 1A) TaxID=694429 RepID=G0EGT4_PYRF1|nr:phosphoribosylformylglycinamidine synthase subunit PurS [Pyrolobus fumarii]AEM39232.1 phosphoribosylformylglycinamidine synthase, purS [Pyrolobus fumarii 1A]
MKLVVELLVFLKPLARDPEAETILSELKRLGYKWIAGLRVGKVYRFTLEARDCEEAERRVLELGEKLRFYNPVVHKAEARCLGESG